MWKDSTGLLLRGKMYWRPNAFCGGGRPGGQLGYVPTAAPMRGLWGGIGPMGCGLGTLHVALAHTRFGGCRWRVQSRRWLRCPPRVPEQLARGLKAARVFGSRFFPSIFSFQSSRVVLFSLFFTAWRTQVLFLKESREFYMFGRIWEKKEAGGLPMIRGVRQLALWPGQSQFFGPVGQRTRQPGTWEAVEGGNSPCW